MHNYLTYSIIFSITVCTVFSFFNKKFYYSSIFYPYGVRSFIDLIKIYKSSLVHFNVSHFFINMGILYIYGSELEHLMVTKHLPRVYFLVIYLCSVTGGGLLEYFVFQKNQLFNCIGASNGIYGVMAATLLFEPFKVIKFIPGINIENIYLIPLIWVLTFYSFKMKDNQVNYCGHLGGLISGLIMMNILK